MKKYVFIYTLEDPITNEIRYVGKTNNLKVRYSNHLVEKAKCHRKNWIKSLKNKGLKPIMKVLDTVPEKEWQFWEIFYISLLKTWGFSFILQLDYFTNEIVAEYSSISQASKELNCKAPAISRVLRGERKKYKNTYFKYKDIV